MLLQMLTCSLWKKPVESATITDIVLVGAMELVVLLCCLEPHSLFFRPEQKKTTKNSQIWNIQAVKQQLRLRYAITFFFACDLLMWHNFSTSRYKKRKCPKEIQRKQSLPWVSKSVCLTCCLLPLNKFQHQVKKFWSFYTMESLRALICWDISNIVTR